MWKVAETVLYSAIGLSLAGDFFVWFFTAQDHPEFWYHYVPGFDFVFGLIGCIVIIKGSKFLAKHWLQRREDYYD
jgi:hypothetical protein